VSSYPLVKYVDSPATTATVRYDFNDQTPNLATSPAKKVTEFDPGVPTLEGDPDAVGQTWGFRSPSITHTIRGTKAQAMAALSAVSREQLRRTNWVLFQAAAGVQPVWFKTYRTGYQPVTLDQVYVRVDGGGQVALPDTWKITIPLVADAFTYGARVTIPTVQIVQAPADLAGPTRFAMRYILPAIKGDAPTNLRVQVTPAAGTFANEDCKWLLVSSSGTATMAHAITDIGTGDGYTAGTGTGAGVADATYFGGSYRLVGITAATPNVINRLSGAFPVLPLGRYKILLRATSGGSAGTFSLLAKLRMFAAGTGLVEGPTARIDVSLAGANHDFWIDLGDFNLPFGITPPIDAGPGPGAISFQLHMGTAEGTALNVKIDAFKFIPIDGPYVAQARTLVSTGPRYQPLVNGLAGVFDGDTDSYWSYTTGTNLYNAGAPTLKGAFLTADPATAQNIVTVMAVDNGTAGAVSAITGLNAQAALDISYHPRYLHVGDGT
jgi:hypothetical protein